MKQYKVLNIKGAVLDEEQLGRYLEKFAADNILKEKSDKDTYPIPRMKENFEVITEVYNLLNEHIKLKIPIHPAGEWILDNYYVIEETVKSIEKDLSPKKYIDFLGLANGAYIGFSRIYVLAAQIVAYTDSKINSKNLQNLLFNYQKKKTLSMDEIWNLGLFIQICIIENIRNICEKIYSSQIQKYKVENIIERLVENKKKEELRFKNLFNYNAKINEYSKLKEPFIEYMSYKLRKYGKKGYTFLNILEEQVNKMGTEISEVIKKEHFDIAVKKVSMGNSITSIKTLSRISFIDIFEEINKVDYILKKDPINVYEKMDYKTKIEYRNVIKQISKKTKISEVYIANKILEFAKKALEENKEEKACHIGYYLIGNGKIKLLEDLKGKKIKRLSSVQKMKIYVFIKILLSIIFSIIVGLRIYKYTNNIFLMIISSILIYIPIENIVVQIMQYILGKCIKPTIMPKLDFSKGVPKEFTSFVVIPTILNSKEKVIEMMKKLEVYYLANKSENIYFTLLGDCTASNVKIEKFDEDIENAGIEYTKLLNKKYKTEGFPKFNFVYRKRVWNEKENCFLGWERKRGLLNQFNEYLLKNISNPFKVNTLEEEKNKLPKVKYIITLDADTELVLNSGLELIGTIAHILNKPVLNKEGTCVVDGYAIIQPRIGIKLNSARKTIFSKIYSGISGIDSYTNAISDFYQDNFNEGIFTGKGIYDLQIFSKVLKNQIPENIVLSHDLLEGSYLRCGLVTDIILMDGYPTSYNSFKTRLNRWTRGDIQISMWLKNKIKNNQNKKIDNPLNIISKYKILDNIIRSIFIPNVMFGIIWFIVISSFYNFKILTINLLLIFSLIIPTIMQILDKIISKKNGEIAYKTFEKNIDGVNANIIKALLEIAFLPDKAYTLLDAMLRSIYRLCFSKKHLLEWITAEEAEKKAKDSLKSYYMDMKANSFLGIIFIILAIVYLRSIGFFFFIILGFLWLSAPFISFYISKHIKEKRIVELLNKEEKNYVLGIGRKTWKFFKENLNEKGNFLPPDNYQEDRKPKLIYRTSPTNIGLGLLAVISSYDLKYENLENTINLLQKILDTILKLNKWNGHLYNWYNIETLEPLSPKYVSTVDSGNFVGYLYVVRQFLEKIDVNNVEEDKEKVFKTVNNEQIKQMIKEIDLLIENTNFKVLYSEENRIFSIGYSVEENSLTDSYYDLLASEARQASLVAIAKKDVEAKHWYSLGRTLTSLYKYKGLISWSGTAFEYLMPSINIPSEEGSLISESIKFAIMSQIEYSKKLRIPWGISESAFNLKDLNNNYQYKAFGIPWLGIKRGLADEQVVSSYGGILAITEKPKEVVNNLKLLESKGMYGNYGFYESIDYTPSRLNKGKEYEIVKTYMAHHQGLILLSINNLFNENILQKRFISNPQIQAVSILLQERMPKNVIITKEKKEKIEKIKNVDYDFYSVREYNKIFKGLNPINVIANEDYTVVIDTKGRGYSKYKDILINRFKETDDEPQGIFFYFKNIKTKRIWSSAQVGYLESADKYKVEFSPDKNKFYRQDGNIETIVKNWIMPEKPIEVRQIELKNIGNSEETIEITSSLEPVLSKKEQDYAHKAFNNLFLSYEFIESANSILVKRKKRDKNENDLYMAVNLYTKGNAIGELEYEIDKEKFIGRGNIGLPEAVKKELPLSKKIGFTLESVIAMKRIVKIMPNEKVKLNLIIAVSENREEVLDLIKTYLNEEKLERSLELSKAKVQAEAIYLGIKARDIEIYQKILGYLIKQNPLKNLMLKDISIEKLPITELWKYGISGDLPILVVEIKEVVDIDVVRETIKAYEYFRIKNMEIDLVIINTERKSYDSYVFEEIQNAILDRNLSYMQNVKGGIFVLNNLGKKEEKILKYRANLFFKASLGEIGRQLKDYEEEFNYKLKSLPKENINKVYINNDKNKEDKSMENLKYYNEYGGFLNNGKEYLIKVNKNNRLPTVWSHILTNERFGSVITESFGGYSWYKNSRLNRLTAWNNSQVTDVPSEVIYIKDTETNNTWSIGLNPMPDDNDYYITYGFGYAKYMHTSCGIVQKMDVYVPREDSLKVSILNLENIETRKKELKLIYYIKPVLGEDEIKTRDFLKLKYEENSNLVMLENVAKEECKTIMYMSCSEKIKSYSGNKESFIGNGNISSPDGINEPQLGKENSIGNMPMLAIEIKVNLEALEQKNIVFVIGAEENLIEMQDKAYQYTNINGALYAYEKEKKYWEELLTKLQVDTPIESINIMLNGWIIYQTMCSRILARSGYYQSGGAFGFRDQLQDTIALKYICPEVVKKQIIRHSKHQFLEGDVEHWWHEETLRGIRTRFSDDLLWLPYLVTEYINFTGDKSILDEKTNYLKGELLPIGIDEKYDIYLPSEKKESIYEHCLKAIEKGINFGKNGLPLIGSGDWNDGFSTVGNKGKGESVWLGFFLYLVLDRIIPVCEEKGDYNISEKYRNIMKDLKKALNTEGWDGRWYRRAFMDDGYILGSLQNEECKIDSIAQSFATISKAGDNDKKYISMESLEKHLIDSENGIIKLLDPPFEKSKLEPGYIKSYLPGTRENGGQYTHGAVWVVIAEAMLGFGDKAVEYFRMINPIEHSRTKEEAKKYKVEPYVMAADIYGAGNLIGRGGWTWYTGSSSWFYEAGIRYILGLKIENGVLEIEPCIASNWQEYKIKYKYGESIYNIKVTNPNRKCIGITKMKLNDKIIENKKIRLTNTGGIYNIEVEI